MTTESNQEPLQELKHSAVGAYPLVFLVVTAALGIYLGVVLYSSPGKIKKADKYKTEKAYKEKSQKKIK